MAVLEVWDSALGEAATTMTEARALVVCPIVDSSSHATTDYDRLPTQEGFKPLGRRECLELVV